MLLSSRRLKNIVCDDSIFVFNINVHQFAPSEFLAWYISLIVSQIIQSNATQTFFEFNYPDDSDCFENIVSICNGNSNCVDNSQIIGFQFSLQKLKNREVTLSWIELNWVKLSFGLIRRNTGSSVRIILNSCLFDLWWIKQSRFSRCFEHPRHSQSIRSSFNSTLRQPLFSLHLLQSLQSLQSLPMYLVRVSSGVMLDSGPAVVFVDLGTGLTRMMTQDQPALFDQS